MWKLFASNVFAVSISSSSIGVYHVKNIAVHQKDCSFAVSSMVYAVQPGDACSRWKKFSTPSGQEISNIAMFLRFDGAFQDGDKATTK